MPKYRLKKLSSFDNMFVFYAITKATEIKSLNKPKNQVEWNKKL